ncbi:MAG: hypothetical protein GX962_05915 [Epulopiscium sp.]|nr:hypothetical protein [Candidatus Epulonipiscium sp.]
MSDLIMKLKAFDLKENFITFPFYIILNPFKGFNDLKYEKRGRTYFPIVMMILLSLFAICDELYKGFVLSGYYTKDRYINTPYTILISLGPVLLFVIANWSITAITNGIGKLKEIFMVYAYALYPKILLSTIGLMISNFIIVDEIAFSTFFYSFGTVAFAFYLFIGLIIIHEYSFTKAIAMILLTVLSMTIIVFILALFMSLINEVFMFFYTIYTEIRLKI